MPPHSSKDFHTILENSRQTQESGVSGVRTLNAMRLKGLTLPRGGVSPVVVAVGSGVSGSGVNTLKPVRLNHYAPF